MTNLVYNGDFYTPADISINCINRAFRYGDGLFETIRLINGRPVFTPHHIQRISEGLKLLKIEIPKLFSSIDQLEEMIVKLAALNSIHEGGIARLTVWRDSEGRYKPVNNRSVFLLETESYPTKAFQLNEEGFEISIFQTFKKQINPLSKFKSLNSQLYVLGAVFARDNGLDDCLLVNEEGLIIESTNSNVFVVSNGTLYTPSLSDGSVAGIMRMNVINAALKLNIGAYESSLNQQHLLMADEVLLTNSIQGIKWVNAFKHKRYYSKIAAVIIEEINRMALEKVSSN